MEEFIKNLGDYYYTDFILIGILLISFFVCIKHRKRYTVLTYFPVYITSLLITTVLNMLTFFELSMWVLPIACYVDYFFTILELIIFSHFYYQLINNRVIKIAIVISNGLFTLFFIYGFS